MDEIDLIPAVDVAADAVAASHLRSTRYVLDVENARAAVAAAAPLIEAAVRDRIAQEIEVEGRAEVRRLGQYTSDDLDKGRTVGAEDAYRDAIRIARGAA